MKRILHVDVRDIRRISPVILTEYLKALRKHCWTLGWSVMCNENKTYLQIGDAVGVFNPVPILHRVARELITLREEIKNVESSGNTEYGNRS